VVNSAVLTADGYWQSFAEMAIYTASSPYRGFLSNGRPPARRRQLDDLSLDHRSLRHPGFVHLPETAPWLAEYLHEMTTFPKGKHDDQVDSTAQFLDWFKRPFPGQGVHEYYRQLAQEAEKRRKPRPVQTEWAKGSMEWLAQQKKSNGPGK
jgi:hypothetical protein